MSDQEIPLEPGLESHPDHGLAEDPSPSAPDDDSADDGEGAEVNDYDAYPDDPDEEDD